MVGNTEVIETRLHGLVKRSRLVSGDLRLASILGALWGKPETGASKTMWFRHATSVRPYQLKANNLAARTWEIIDTPRLRTTWAVPDSYLLGMQKQRLLPSGSVTANSRSPNV